MTYLRYPNAKTPSLYPKHWTEDRYEIHEFLIWMINENQIDYRDALKALGVTTLCDWRGSQAEAKEKILAYLEANQ